MYTPLSSGDFQLIRQTLLIFFQDMHIRVSLIFKYVLIGQRKVYFSFVFNFPYKPVSVYSSMPGVHFP